MNKKLLKLLRKPTKLLRLPVKFNNLLIDQEDRWILDLKLGWWIGKRGYVVGKTKTKHLKLHHCIIGRPVRKGYCVDHKNGNKLDNRKENLHIVPIGHNATNRKKSSLSKQPYKGIQRLPSGSWRAKGSKGKHLGTFKTAEEAYKRYLLHVEEKYGEELLNLKT